MPQTRYFMDTAFAQALINPRDQYHQKARQVQRQIPANAEIFTTNIILIEIADALSALRRHEAITFINNVSIDTKKFKVVDLDKVLYNRGFVLYSNRRDKDWGLTDCISFMVMNDSGIDTALTTDQHFVQYGFRALMLEP
jgi:uncharacterized protein